jgi:hypothetical protein
VIRDKQIAQSLLFLSPVSTARQSPANDSDTSTRMAVPPRQPSLSKERHRALTLLASFPRGMFEDLLVVAQDFDRAMIVSLIESGLATAQRELVTAPGYATIEVVRITISDDGRRALDASATSSA